MGRVALLHGAYSAKSVIANAQRCCNLYPEANQDDAPTQVTHYPTPGLTLRATAGASIWRALYQTTNNQLFGVCGANVYKISSGWSLTLIGAIAAGSNTVSLCDNGSICVIVNGANAYWFDINTPAGVNAITDTAFYAADRVCYLDGYFCMNRVGTNQFFISPPFWDGVDPLDPLDIAAKIGGADPIATLAVIHRELWLIGILTTEVWYNSGGADFPFERQPGAFVDHGIVAGYTIAQADIGLYFLHRDQQGQCVVMQGSQYQAIRVSTFAVENEIQRYAVVLDAIGFCYQQEGHTFYVLTFPTANKTWVYDIATKEWHERTYQDTNRIRANCFAAAFGKAVVGDWQNGKLYTLEPDVGTDDGVDITRRRGFPHVVKDANRIATPRLVLDMQPGTDQSSTGAEVINLRWSDTRGRSWTGALSQNMQFGTTDQNYASYLFTRLGMARDRVYEVYWTFPQKTALQGAWLEPDEAQT